MIGFGGVLREFGGVLGSLGGSRGGCLTPIGHVLTLWNRVKTNTSMISN